LRACKRLDLIIHHKLNGLGVSALFLKGHSTEEKSHEVLRQVKMMPNLGVNNKKQSTRIFCPGQ